MACFCPQVVPKRQRFTNEALEQAFASDVVALQALLAGLSPILAPGARVVAGALADARGDGQSLTTGPSNWGQV